MLLYWRSLVSPFVYDDLDQIVNNPNLSSWSAFVQRFLLHPVALTTSFAGYGGSTYRPLFWLSLFVDRAIWGLHAGGFHATNLALHLANGNLGFAALRRLNIAALPAAAVCLLWLSLPIDTEAVAWISGRSYALCVLFVLLCLLAAMHAARREGWAARLACFAAAACAVLSNELGVVVLPLLLLLFVSEQPALRERSRERYWTLGMVLLAGLSVEALRIGVGVTSFSGFASPRFAVLAVWKYAVLTLLPLHMSVERSTSLSPGQPQSWLFAKVLLLGAVYGYAGFRRRSHPAVLAGLLWFAIGIAPFVMLGNYQGMAERFAYLASFGMAAAVVAACCVPGHARLRSFLVMLVAAWGLWNLYRTTVRVADWSDPVRLYRSSLQATPQSPRGVVQPGLFAQNRRRSAWSARRL